jgi:hypothetical protein
LRGAWRAALESRAAPVALGAIALAAVAVVLARRRWQREPSAHPCYARALRLLARRGFVRESGATARAFAHEVARALPAAAAAAFAQLTEAYLCERFGARAAQGARALAEFERALPSRTRATPG